MFPTRVNVALGTAVYWALSTLHVAFRCKAEIVALWECSLCEHLICTISFHVVNGCRVHDPQCWYLPNAYFRCCLVVANLSDRFKTNHSAENSKFLLFAFNLLSHRIMRRKKTIWMKSYFLYELFIIEVWSSIGTWHVHDGTRCHANCVVEWT